MAHSQSIINLRRRVLPDAEKSGNAQSAGLGFLRNIIDNYPQQITLPVLNLTLYVLVVQ